MVLASAMAFVCGSGKLEDSVGVIERVIAAELIPVKVIRVDKCTAFSNIPDQ